MKFDEPSWIPAPLQRCWREGCKPDRILNHIRRFHEEMPTRVSEEHVKAYEDWLAKEDAEDYVYEAFQWPVPKCRPMTDPNRAAPVGRGVRPPADVAREAASNAAGETMPHSTTNSGDASACRAASAASVRANDRRDAARSAIARDVCVLRSNTWQSRGWGREGVSWCVTALSLHPALLLLCCADLVPPDHGQGELTPPQEASLPQPGCHKTPLG